MKDVNKILVAGKHMENLADKRIRILNRGLHQRGMNGQQAPSQLT